jgi:hypothetical protein
MVLNGEGKLEVQVIGTVHKWHQITQWDANSSNSPTSVMESAGTQVLYSSEIYSDGCVRLEIPEGEDFVIYVTYIEGVDRSCYPSAGENCWRWEAIINVGKDEPINTSCSGAYEREIDITDVQAEQGSCDYEYHL